MKQDLQQLTDRRNFIGSIATGAMAMSFAGMAAPLHAMAAEKVRTPHDDPEAWFNTIKGKHKMVFDVTSPHEIFPFAWPKVFLMTNQMTGTPEKDSNAVVVFRHNAIPYAFNDSMWLKYKFGEHFNLKDPSGTALTANPFAHPAPGQYKIPGIGAVAIGINELQSSGVMFCVCNMAMTVNSAVIAQKMNMDSTAVLNDLTSNALPGVQIVPSGVWAVGRAQEHGCAYCFVA